MEANDVLLTMALRGAGIELGSTGVERLCASFARLGIAVKRAGDGNGTSPAAIATAVPATLAIVTIEITRDATRVEIGPR